MKGLTSNNRAFRRTKDGYWNCSVRNKWNVQQIFTLSFIYTKNTPKRNESYKLVPCYVFLLLDHHF